MIIFYKEGYMINSVQNEDRPIAFFLPLKSEWTGKDIKLIQFTGDLKDYTRMKEGLGFLLGRITDNKNSSCQWHNYPKMVLARNLELPDKNYYEGIIESKVEVLPSDGCGTYDVFLKRYNNERQ